MKITVNGNSRQVASTTTISDLLRELDVQTPLVAVERNRVIVPKRQHACTLLVEGDAVEVVTFVGGG